MTPYGTINTTYLVPRQVMFAMNAFHLGEEEAKSLVNRFPQQFESPAGIIRQAIEAGGGQGLQTGLYRILGLEASHA